MANPNLTNAGFVKTAKVSWLLDTNATAVLTNAAASNRLFKVLHLDLTNNTGAAKEASVYFRRSSINYYIASTVAIPKNSSLSVITGEGFLYLQEGDSLFAVSPTVDEVHLDLTYQILSESDFTYSQQIISLTTTNNSVSMSGGVFTIKLKTEGYVGPFPYNITGVASSDINNAALSGNISNGQSITYNATASSPVTFVFNVLGTSVSVSFLATQPFYFSLTATGTGRTVGTPTVVDTYSNSNFIANHEYTGYYRISLPSSRTYRITAQGANGGRGTTNPSPLNFGARIVAEGSITGGTFLILLAGQTGTPSTDNEGAGGGGGSFVAQGSTVSTASPFVIAGGAGGSANLTNNNGFSLAQGYGSLTQQGRAGWASGQTDPGTWAVGEGANGSGNIAGFWGGGFFSSGSGQLVRSDGTNGGGFRQGGFGGGNNGNINAGGFGGGASGSTNCGYGGGGGGYTGGGAGGWAAGCGGHGGGAGSFVAASLTQTSATNVSATYGSIIIEGI